jgi:outer membrane lipoprotein-sorting protein
VRLLTLILSLLLASPALAEDPIPTAEQLLAAIDANMVFDTRTAVTKMTVQTKRRTRTFEMISYGRGADESAVEYRAPAREKGTRMLKKGDDLWLYLPSVDRTQKISGHMLRQGMMGSDVSYEDMMASAELSDMYTAKVTGEDTVDGRRCWTLELLAKDDTVTYPKRVSWLDAETLIPIKQELYALSGMLLKSWIMSDVKEFEGGRMFPTKMVIQDHLKTDSVTTLEFPEMKFGVDVEEEVFSMRWLERK